MKIIRIAWKSLLEQVRDYRTLLMSFAFPISFIIIFGLVMGKNYYTYKIFILNNDRGMTIEQVDRSGDSSNINYGEEFIERLKKTTYEDGTEIFKIRKIKNENEVGKKLEKNEYAALIIIPEDFTPSLRKNAGGSTVEVRGDPGYPSYSLVKIGIDYALDRFLKEKTGYTAPAKTITTFISESTEGSEFNYLAPGLMLMAIYLLLIQVAMVLSQEIENKTLVRLKMSNVKTWQLLAGVSSSQVVFSVVMVPLMLYSAILVGFHSKGSLLLGIFFGVMASISAVAIALIVSAFSKTVKEAFLWGNIICIPIIFFSGIFFPMPDYRLFAIAGRSFTVWDLMPPTHAHKAFLQIFLYGAGFGDLIYELIMLILVTIIYFWIGVILFNHAHLKR